jgi:type I restriction enzyme, S subunit
VVIRSDAMQVAEPAAPYLEESDLESVQPGYQRTAAGIIPEDWRAIDLPSLCILQRGFDLTEATRKPGSVPVYSSSGLSYFHDKPMVNPPGVVTGRKGLLGRVFLIYEPFWPHDTTLWVKDFRGNEPQYVALILERFRLERLDAATAVPTLNRNNLVGHFVPVPGTNTEQRAIVEALSDAEELLGALDAQIGKKRAIQQAAMQQLLTAKTRLPGFHEKWKTKKIIDIARPSGERNHSSAQLPVLSCTKHVGFVESLRYFKNQVFSDELGSYKVIRRGEIGYPANHIEEGSIGLQDLYDAALVSPIYVVLSPISTINSYFLHRLLRLDTYRHVFASATNSSVDRRGSLLWPDFSQIGVKVPPRDEQDAIATVLSDMDAEIAALESRRDKTRGIKKGMMQQLLTGRIRLVKPKAAA